MTWEFLAFFLLGLFVAANVPFIQKFLSVQEFFYGIMKGMSQGDAWKKERQGKKAEEARYQDKNRRKK